VCGALQRALPRQPPPVVGGCERRDDANDAEGREKLAVWRLGARWRKEQTSSMEVETTLKGFELGV
jgi:hypothetical protein